MINDPIKIKIYEEKIPSEWELFLKSKGPRVGARNATKDILYASEKLDKKPTQLSRRIDCAFELWDIVSVAPNNAFFVLPLFE